MPVSDDLTAKALDHLLPPGQVVELRAPDANAGRNYTCTVSGYYDDPVKLAVDAAGIDAPGVYFTLNPADPRLLARRNNRLKQCRDKEPTTADKDIVRRRWLFVEVDPVRPSGICASGGEKAEAGHVADAVAVYLRGEGWPDPLAIDSGNGFYLLYRVDLPADDSGLVANCLKALAHRFDTTAAHVDTSVFNPARIARLPGTMNRKGDSTPDRPHRRCVPLVVPETMELVSGELLDALAATAPADEKKQATANANPNTNSDDFQQKLIVPKYLAHFGLKVLSTNTGDGGQTRWRLQCPFNPDHSGTDAYVFQYPSGAVGFHCSHNSCSGNRWEGFKATVGWPLPEHYDPPKVQARATFNGQTFGGSANGKHSGGRRQDRQEPAGAQSARFTPELLKASEVQQKKIPWLWPGRFPLGRAAMIAGRGGLGKTILECEMAATVSRGRNWPDGHQAPRGQTIILSAEDDVADTLKPRLMAAGADCDQVFFLQGAWAKTEDGKTVRKFIDLRDGLDQIEQAADQCPQLKLVMVDPVGSYLGRGTDSHRDNEVRESIGGICRLAAARGFAVVFVAHNNKSTLNAHADDAVLGSRAFTAAVRAVQHLIQDPDDKNRLLLMPGKCNLAQTPTGLAYTLDSVEVPDAGEHPRVCWCPDPVEGDANNYIGGGAGRRSGGEGGGGGRNSSERKEAGEFLLTLLADGPVLVKEIRREATDAGLSWATIRRAKDEAGITSKKRRGAVKKGEELPWYWGVGDEWEPPTAEGAHIADFSDGPLISHASEHLRGEQGRKTANTPDFPEGAQPDEPSEHLRGDEHLLHEDAHEGAHQDDPPEGAQN